MPDITYLLKGEKTEYLNFLQWLASEFGVWRATTRHEWGPNRYKASAEYKQWTQRGRPKVRATPEPILTEYAKGIFQRPPKESAEEAEKRIGDEQLQQQLAQEDYYRRYGLWQTDVGLALQKYGQERQAWEAEQGLGFQRERLAQEQLGLQEAEKERRYNLEQQRLALLLSPPTMSNQERASIWESARQEILGQWRQDPYRNWIKIQTEQMNPTRNPYAQKPLDYAQTLRYKQEQLDKLQTAYTAASGVVEMAKGSPWIQATEADINRVKVLGEAIQATQRGIAEVRLNPEDYTPDETPARPSAPATPSWLKRIYPNMPANIEKRETMPLSGQLWSQLAPSEQQGWMGYAEWAGGVPEDIRAQMEAMQPRTPRTAYQWSPARQYA